MIGPILSKIYKSILENKINLWLQSHGKRDKGHAKFRGYHSIVDHLIMLRIIAEECCNNKTNLYFLLTLGKLLTLSVGPTFEIG
jgi:hypothetical protein